ncbi:MAG TPA: YeeE/YedE thiosulfate transporter family protein [Polyangiales bacterium]|nr:YeeE/YedE thiosulfate transporter family protein [Polyangiales bacterium]
MHDFTPWSALTGGALIGAAASLLLIAAGRIAGISGILGGVLLPARGDVRWRALFLVGLVSAGLIAALLVPESIGTSPRSLPMLTAAGLLVGIGTRLGNGCTSGHGVCGISRFAPRSIAATVVFMASGVLTVLLTHLIGGGV